MREHVYSETQNKTKRKNTIYHFKINYFINHNTLECKLWKQYKSHNSILFNILERKADTVESLPRIHFAFHLDRERWGLSAHLNVNKSSCLILNNNDNLIH